MDSRPLLLLLLALAFDVKCASGRTAARHLGVYRSPSSGSSPGTSYGTPSPSGGSPSSSSPTPYTSTPSGSSPSAGSSPGYTSPSSSGSSPSGSSPEYTPPTSSGSSPSSTYTPPSEGGSSPVAEGPAGSYTPPPSGSSPVVGSPSYSGVPSSGSSPLIGAPIASPITSPGVESPFSSPLVGSPLSSPLIGSPLSSPTTPEISTPTTPSGGGGKGSCGFWSKHGVKFPSALSRLASLRSIFGGQAGSIFGSKMTLVEALANPNLDEYSALARQGTASLLNAFAYPQAFRFTPTQVLSSFQAGLQSPFTARQQASVFEDANSSLS